jgi:hypothetical protein
MQKVRGQNPARECAHDATTALFDAEEISMNRNVLRSALVAAILLVGFPSPGQTAIVNGGFETGTFAGWNTIGDTSVQTASVGISPTQGCCMALLTTINTDVGGVPFSLQFAANGVIGSFLGYSFAELQNIPVAYPGHNEPYGVGQSAIKQTVQGHAGELLSFDSYWVSADVDLGVDGGVLSVAPSTSGPKFLVFLSPPFRAGSGTASPVPLCQHDGNFLPPFSSCPSSFNRTTGWQHFDVLLPSTDTYTIGFAVWNTVDSLAQSALFVDNVQLRVPQPSGMLLVGVGLVGLLLARRVIGRLRQGMNRLEL